MREYDLYLPLCDNAGVEIDQEKIEGYKRRLRDRFGGLTFFPQPNEGIWKVGGVTFREAIVVLRVLADEVPQPRDFFVRFKEELKRDLDQEDILIVERDVRRI